MNGWLFMIGVFGGYVLGRVVEMVIQTCQRRRRG